jgi:hypothetical protein
MAAIRVSIIRCFITYRKWHWWQAIAVKQQKLPYNHSMHLSQNSGIERFISIIIVIIYKQWLYTRNLFGTSVASLSHFVNMSDLSILEFCFQKMVRTQSAVFLEIIMFTMRILWKTVFWQMHNTHLCVVRMKLHYSVSDLTFLGYLFQHERPKTRIIIRNHGVFLAAFLIDLLHRKFSC